MRRKESLKSAIGIKPSTRED